MELHEAIAKISEIHAQLRRTETFRGTRALPMAITSGLAVLAAVVQARSGDRLGVDGVLALWIGYALLSAFVCALDLLQLGVLSERQSRRQAFFVVSQFLPALLVGAIVTAVVFPLPLAARTLLPGLWTLLFAVGIFSSAPSLARGLRWVAGFYVLAGAGILAAGSGAVLPPAWCLGLTFAVGQAAAALALHAQQERTAHV